MGRSLPPPADRPGLNPDGSPVWPRVKGVKTGFDFPRARRGEVDRYEFRVGERAPGRPRRLDKFLMVRFTGYSRSFLQKLVKDGRVLVDGKEAKSSWHVTPGQRIAVLLPEGIKHEPEDIGFEVLYEDPWMLALAKPAGLVVHPARGNKTGTLYNGLLHYFRARLESDPSFHIGIVHRLDEHTSGVMIVALDKKANRDLTRQFEDRLLKKTYLCLVHGHVPFEETEVDAALGVDPQCRVAVAVDGLDAREARTRFVCLARSRIGRFSLLRAHPRTGRSHQIRVHARETGHPIVADELYGGRASDPAFGAITPRMCLHAEALELTHPIEGRPMTLAAPLPPDIADLARHLGVECPS